MVPVRILEDDVEIIDCSWDRTRLSELEPVWIARYLPLPDEEDLPLTGAEIAACQIRSHGQLCYWFHQTPETSAYDPVHPVYGKFGHLINDYGATLAAAGCSVYALAIALSNALKRCITPYDVLLRVLKAPISEAWSVSLDGSRGIDMLHQPYPMVDPKSLCASVLDAYPECGAFEIEDLKNSRTVVDRALQSGGLIYLCLNPCAVYTGKSAHFVVLWKNEPDGKYYFLSSGAFDTYGSGEPDLIRGMRGVYMTWEELCEAIPMRPCNIAFLPLG